MLGILVIIGGFKIGNPMMGLTLSPVFLLVVIIYQYLFQHPERKIKHLSKRSSMLSYDKNWTITNCTITLVLNNTEIRIKESKDGVENEYRFKVLSNYSDLVAKLQNN